MPSQFNKQSLAFRGWTASSINAQNRAFAIKAVTYTVLKTFIGEVKASCDDPWGEDELLFNTASSPGDFVNIIKKEDPKNEPLQKFIFDSRVYSSIGVSLQNLEVCFNVRSCPVFSVHCTILLIASFCCTLSIQN